MADQTITTPASESSDYCAMKGAWALIDDILAGIETIRSKKTEYLPRYEDESKAEYDRRLSTAPWRPEFDDALRNLSAKPFEKDVSLQGEPSQRVKDIAADIDGRGNNITAFSRDVFRGGVAKGLHGVLVDYPTMAPGLTLADERRIGAKPYWVHLPAGSIIACYTRIEAGKEIIEHIRIRETLVQRSGWGETCTERVRILEPGHFEIWEQDSATTAWVKVQEGPITIPLVPVALFFTAPRTGQYRVKPPLLDLAHMQIELYQALSREDEIQTFAGSPMLKAVGMSKPAEGEPQIAVGPKRILFAPAAAEGVQPDWDFIQPNAENMKEVREKVQSVIEDMRRLGMQPLTDKTGNVTATGTSVEAAKAHSTAQAWAIALKDVLERAFEYTQAWEKSSEKVEVSVHTDFGVDLQGVEEFKSLQGSRMSGDISRQTLWDEGVRRGILGPQFDPEEEARRLQEEPPPLGVMGEDDEEVGDGNEDEDDTGAGDNRQAA